MVASFSASNQVGEMMKKTKRVKPKTDEHQTTTPTPKPEINPEEEV
jgi:hypothetical protein